MPWMMILNNRFFQIAVGILVLLVVLFLGVKYVERSAQKEIQLDILKKEVETERRTRDATKSAPDNVRDALEFLRNRNP